jgi:outer membrane protein OmpA-like peptidoglycan-associated protein
MMQRTATIAALAFNIASAALAAPAAAQRAPTFAGVELRLGVVFPEHAVAGPAVMGEIDLGYVWRPELRAIAGLSHFRANIDREPGGDEGSFAATGIWLGGRYDLLARSTTAAYVRAALTLHSVSADAWDTDVDALLAGTNIGAGIAIGARRTLDAAGRISGTFELRRTALNNLANTAIEIGVRFQQRGAAAYTAETVAAAPRLYDPQQVPPTPAERLPPQPAVQPPGLEPAARDTAARDTAANRRADLLRREMEAEAAARGANLAQRQAREAAMEERSAGAAAAERAAAAQALLRQGLARAAAAMGSVTRTHETDAAFIVTLSGGAFATGASTLSASARGEVRVLATVLAGYPGHIITLEGHTDAVGDPARNQALSLERASAVRLWGFRNARNASSCAASARSWTRHWSCSVTMTGRR